MSVREVYDSPGSFRLPLKTTTPPSIRQQVSPFDHLVVFAQGGFDIRRFDDATALANARYTGPVTSKTFESEPFSLEGAGMGWHLQDAQGNGPILADTVAYSAATLTTVMDTRANGGIIPASLSQGTITNTTGTFTGTFYPADTSLAAFRTVMDTLDAHYRINPDGSVDAGPAGSNEVYRVDETTGNRLAVAIREGWGSDPQRTSVENLNNRTLVDGREWVSRAVVADIDYTGVNSIAYFKDRAVNPYYDINNNLLIRNKVSGRPASDVTDLETFADRQLESANVQQTIDIDINQWEIARGEIQVGDFMWVYDPEAGISTQDNEIQHRGLTIFPERIRILEADWPFTDGMGVYIRPGGASVTTFDYIDVTDYVDWENVA